MRELRARRYAAFASVIDYVFQLLRHYHAYDAIFLAFIDAAHYAAADDFAVYASATISLLFRHYFRRRRHYVFSLML